MGTWESHRKTVSMNGLLPNIKVTVQRSVAGMEDSRLVEVKTHAQSIGQEKTSAEEQNPVLQHEQAQLTMLQAITQLTEQLPI